MEKSPANTESHQMSDVAMARGYVEEIGGSTQAKVAIGATFKWLSKLFPHKDEPKNQWTERRVRSFWNEEAALVEFREMVELHRAAEAARIEREKQKARSQHAQYREETARMAALAVVRNAPPDSNLAP